MVTLEAEARSDDSSLADGILERLTEALSSFGAQTRKYQRRYVVQLRVEAESESDALCHAAAGWKQAVRALELPTWPLVRAEIVAVGDAVVHDACPPPVPAPDRLGEAELGDELLRRALHDSLTGLVSRELFRDRIRSALTEDGHLAGAWAVMVCDLDQFGVHNSLAGPAVGDRLLMLLASRIMDDFVDCVVGRLGGDSFGLLVPISDPVAADRLAVRLLDAIRVPLVLDGHSVVVTASVGVATSGPLCHPDDLLRHASTAMCVAKACGGDCVRHYEPGASVDVGRLEGDADPQPDRLAYVLLLEQAATAANECSNLCDAAAIVLQQVCAHTSWPLGHLSIASPDGMSVQPTSTWHIRGVDQFDQFRAAVEQTSHARGEGMSGRVLETGGMVRSACGAAGGGSPRLAAGPQGVASGFAFPVLVGREVVAVLEFYGTGSAPLDPSLCEVMAGVGTQLGRVVERSRAQAALARTEERYRTLADSVPVLMWMAGTDGKTTLFNTAWLEFTGQSLEAQLGDGWALGVHPDDRERCLGIYRRALERREPFEMEYRLRRADGEYRWVLDKGRPIGSGDDFQGYVGGCIDVTDRRRAEVELRNNEARFRALVETTGTMIVLLARDGSIIAEYLGLSGGVGYPEGSAEGRSGFEFLHPDDIGRAAAEFEQTLSKPGVTAPFQCRVRHADGTWRWVEAVGNNLLDYPPVQAIVISAHDITERKQLAQALAEANEKLRHAENPPSVRT